MAADTYQVLDEVVELEEFDAVVGDVIQHELKLTHTAHQFSVAEAFSCLQGTVHQVMYPGIHLIQHSGLHAQGGVPVELFLMLFFA